LGFETAEKEAETALRTIINTVTPLAVGYVLSALISVALIYAGRTNPIRAKSVAIETGD